MRLTRSLGFAAALVAAALIGGTVIGSTLATNETDTDTDTTASAGTYCEVFMDALAGDLGVTRESLTAAGQSAANAAIDAAIEAGDLSDERADALRERFAEYDGSGCGWFGRIGAFGKGFHHGFDRGVARGLLGGNLFEAAADALGIESSDLVGHLRDAGSLEALAEELGASYDEVKASIIAAVQADLDAAVEEGLSQERADAVIERVTTWLDEGGELGTFGPGRGYGPRFGPGWWDSDGSDGADTDA